MFLVNIVCSQKFYKSGLCLAVVKLFLDEKLSRAVNNDLHKLKVVTLKTCMRCFRDAAVCVNAIFILGRTILVNKYFTISREGVSSSTLVNLFVRIRLYSTTKPNCTASKVNW